MRNIVLLLIVTVMVQCQNKTVNYELPVEVISASDTIQVTSSISRREKLSYPIRVIGKIRSSTYRNVTFEREGIVLSKEIVNGSFVREGQVLIKLKNENERLKLQIAEISLDKAEANYENAILALGDSSYYKENWNKVKEKAQLNSGLLAAEVTLKQARLAYQQTIIRAPISGIIEGIQINPGDYVAVNSTLGSIYDHSSFEVVSEVLEYDVMKLKKGMKAKIHLLTNDKQVFEGFVREINPAINHKGISRVTISIKNPKNVIPGLSTHVDILVSDTPSIIVPLKAIIKHSERHVVFNIEDGLAKWNYVTLGKENGKEIQVLEGLSEDMEIITSNNLQLAHDSPVKSE